MFRVNFLHKILVFGHILVVGSINTPLKEYLMKYCTTCKKHKPRTEYNKNPSKKDGLGGKCRQCMKAYRKIYYKRNSDSVKQKVAKRKLENRKWFKEFKSKLSCEQCGENHISTIDFHHIDPEKKEFEVSFLVGANYSKATILKEVNKCKILCANCHRKLHFNINNNVQV